MSPPDAQRLLVLRALGLGDLCAAVPALRGLRRGFPGHHLVLAVPRSLEPLARLTGAVDEVLDATGLDRPLPDAARGADVAVNLHGRGPQSSRRLEASRPARLLAFVHPDVPATAGGPLWDDEEHEVHRWCRLVGATGAPAVPADLLLDRPPPAIPAGRPDPDVVVHPGAASPARRWPAERWGAVVRALLDDGRRVTITGAPDEVALAACVARRAGADGDPRCEVVAGRTDVIGLAGLVAQAGLLLAGDTGVAHLATAFATPSVLLFGPTSPARWGPATDGPHTVLWAGRTGDPHAAVPDAGLLAIEVADVLHAVARRSLAAG